MWDTVWEEVFCNQAWGKYPGEELIRFVARNFYQVPDRSRTRILELGCGPGANIWYLAREGFGFAGVDGSPTAIGQATARLDAECTGWRERGELVVGDIRKLDYPDESFDAVIDNEAGYCNEWTATQAIYREAERVTKASGKIFLRTFAEGSWGDRTGEPVGHHAWFCAEGPLAGKGYSRFTAANEIADLIAPYRVNSVELLTWTLSERRNEIREWIILGEKGQP
jgi:SAM-dependent methyltransferase